MCTPTARELAVPDAHRHPDDVAALTKWALALAAEVGPLRRLEVCAAGTFVNAEVELDFENPSDGSTLAERFGLTGRPSFAGQSRFVGLVDGIEVTTWGNAAEVVA